MNTAMRMVYPFLPALARGLGLSLVQASNLVALRSFTGVFSPFLSPLSERHGRRPVLLAALVAFGAANLIVVLWPEAWAFGLTLALVALAKVVYDPVLQAFIGDAVPYRQRGRAIAATEVSWSLALLLGAPLVGWLIARGSWRAPFAALAVLGLVGAAWLWRVLPRVRPAPAAPTRRGDLARAVRRHPQIVAAGLYVLLIMVANEILFIVYGEWMEVRFGLSLGGLGLASGLIGGVELGSEGLAGWSVDRFGKRPVVITAGALAALSYVAVPLLGRSLTTALGAIAIMFLFFELTVVGGLPLLTELVPAARSLVMSAVVAGTALGRAAGAALGPLLYARGGLWLNGVVSAALTLAAIAILALWLREGETPEPPAGR